MSVLLCGLAIFTVGSDHLKPLFSCPLVLQELPALGGQRGLARSCDGVLLSGRSSGGLSKLCGRNAFFLPVEVQPPLQDDLPQENTEDLTMQVPEEPSHSDQPGTGHLGVLEVSQTPDSEKDEHPGKPGQTVEACHKEELLGDWLLKIGNRGESNIGLNTF